MDFSKKLKTAMQELHLTQAQVCGMTGIGKSSISMYLNGKNEPQDERKRKMALSLGLSSDYFEEKETIVTALQAKANSGRVQKLLVEDAAKLLGMSHDTVRKGLQQGVFPWGYAIKTSGARWVYFINAKRFSEIERL